MNNTYKEFPMLYIELINDTIKNRMNDMKIKRKNIDIDPSRISKILNYNINFKEMYIRESEIQHFADLFRYDNVSDFEDNSLGSIIFDIKDKYDSELNRINRNFKSLNDTQKVKLQSQYLDQINNIEQRKNDELKTLRTSYHNEHPLDLLMYKQFTNDDWNKLLSKSLDLLIEIHVSNNRTDTLPLNISKSFIGALRDYIPFAISGETEEDQLNPKYLNYGHRHELYYNATFNVFISNDKRDLSVEVYKKIFISQFRKLSTASVADEIEQMMLSTIKIFLDFVQPTKNSYGMKAYNLHTARMEIVNTLHFDPTIVFTNDYLSIRTNLLQSENFDKDYSEQIEHLIQKENSQLKYISSLDFDKYKKDPRCVLSNLYDKSGLISFLSCL